MNPEDIINKIKESEIKPISKAYFVFRRSLFWAVAIITTFFGAVSFAYIIGSLLVFDWQYWDYVSESILTYTYTFIPFLWVLFLILFIVFIPYIIKNTVNGYKYKKYAIIFTSVFISLILGITLLKVSIKIETQDTMFIKGNLIKQMSMWQSPLRGKIIGEVKLINGETAIVRDIEGAVWIVDISHLLPKSDYVINNNKFVRIIGSTTKQNEIIACQVVPFEFELKDEYLKDRIVKEYDFSKIEEPDEICIPILKP